MDNRIAVIGIMVTNRSEAAQEVNRILGEYSDVIVGRMGIPYREKGISVISIIVDGTSDQIGAISGKLGNIKNVKSKVAMMN